MDLSYLMKKYGFSPPLNEMRASVSRTASESEVTSNSEVDPKEANHLQKRKHIVPDERYDEMGLILEPWRVSFYLQDL